MAIEAIKAIEAIGYYSSQVFGRDLGHRPLLGADESRRFYGVGTTSLHRYNAASFRPGARSIRRERQEAHSTLKPYHNILKFSHPVFDGRVLFIGHMANSA